MSNYWADQPVSIVKSEKEIDIIIKNFKQDITEVLPDGFQFKTLNVSHLDDIHSLLTKHYIEDDDHLVRLVYSKDFLYWYLRYIPSGYIIGLTFNNKLIGMITATFIDMIVYQKKLKVPYINFLCVQSKLRSMGFGPMLMNEMKSRLNSASMGFGLFTSMKKPTKNFAISNDFVIPINYPKLKEIEFLVEDIKPIPVPESNPLHLLVASDLDSVIPKLNSFMEKFDVKIYFTNDSAHHFLLPKKNIVYSFVNRTNSSVTDFVCVYVNYLYSIQKNKMISVAQLAFYYHETMSLTDLILFLLNKLPSYGIDQFVFRDIADNPDINLTKFSTNGELNYFFYNVAIKETPKNKLCLLPI
jgi:glycylpeptide N-tetradecanoyltransferase